MLNEDNTTEKKIINSLKEVGWTYVESEKLRRNYEDVFNEQDLLSALKRFNPSIARHEQFGYDVIGKLKNVVNSCQSEGLISSNEKMMKLLRGEMSLPMGENGRHVTVKFIDYDDPLTNDFVITHQLMYPFHSSNHGKRFDIVLYVNGIPIVVGECKTPVRPSITWADGAKDICDYEKSVTKFFVPNVLNFATEGKIFRYGVIGNLAMTWMPWHLNGLMDDNSIHTVGETSKSLLNPSTILDIMRNYSLYGTTNYRRSKTVCRYQQYEGANAIVERVRIGSPKKGLIWHFQGSGKSNLMLFAAQKLRGRPELRNPAVIIVVDRTELDDQITGTFALSDVPETVNAESIADLQRILDNDSRKIIITTIQKFQGIPADLNTSPNIVVLIDEAHRTQYDNLGIYMRKGLPNAFFFGLTGTPLNKKNKNTIALFGGEGDKDGYLSKYTCEDSLRDKATLPLRFVPVDIRMHVDQDAIDEEFEKIADGLTDEEKEKLKDKASKFETLVTKPERLGLVIHHIADHFKKYVEPAGFKAMIVAYNRRCCVLYKKELDKLLPPEWSTIVMHAGSKDDEFKEWKMEKGDWEIIKRNYNDPNHPLKILIVTSRLITGFDSQILQTMYLDKPLKEHTLMQAICRTNRVMPPDKQYGVIVDYLGQFDRVGEAFGKSGNGAPPIENIQDIKDSIPIYLQECLKFFESIDRSVDDYTTLEAAQEVLKNLELKDAFGMAFQKLHRAWELISPDPDLAQYLADYKWVCHVYDSQRSGSVTGTLVWQAFGKKTIELIHKNTEVVSFKENSNYYDIDEDTLRQIIDENPDDPDKAVTMVEIRVSNRLSKHMGDPVFKKLGERLEALRAQHELAQISSIEFLKKLLELSKDTLAAEKKVETLDQRERGKAALTELFNEIKNENTPIIVENIVNDIDQVVNKIRFPGWQDVPSGRKEVRRAILKIVRTKYRIKDEEVLKKAYDYVEQYYPVEENMELDSVDGVWKKK